jgi:hypothetical protein
MFKKLLPLLFLFAGFQVNAGLIYQADSVVADRSVNASYGPIEALINQSGLSASYVSGVTDFDVFTSGTSGANVSLGVVGLLAPFPINVDFTYSNLLNIDHAAVWGAGFGQSSLETFELYASASGSFTDLVFLSIGTSSFSSLPTILTFLPTDVLGVRMILRDSYGGFDDIRFDEFAVGGTLAQPAQPAGQAPEPSIIALFGLGLIGIGFARRRQS